MTWAKRWKRHTSFAPAADQIARIAFSACAVIRVSLSPALKWTRGLGRPRASSSSLSVRWL